MSPQVAAQKMNAGPLCNEVLQHGHRLGPLQIGQRTGEIVGHPLYPGEPDPCHAAFPIVGGRIECGLPGAPAVRHGAEVVQDFTLQAHQRKTIGLIIGNSETTLNQPQGCFLTIFGSLRAGRGQEGAPALGILGALQMFGAQHRIPLGIPCGRTPMQLPSPAPEQGVVDGVSYQSVRKQKDVAICLMWPDEKPRY